MMISMTLIMNTYEERKGKIKKADSDNTSASEIRNWKKAWVDHSDDAPTKWMTSTPNRPSQVV
jgi:hypothetical protein